MEISFRSISMQAYARSSTPSWGVRLIYPRSAGFARARELLLGEEPVLYGDAHAAELVVVLRGLEGDVVTEPLRLLVGVGVAADVDEQRGVVDDRSLRLVKADP